MVARGDGRYPKLLAKLRKVGVFILDDWGLMKLSAEHRRGMLKALEDRQGIRSTMATSQAALLRSGWQDSAPYTDIR